MFTNIILKTPYYLYDLDVLCQTLSAATLSAKKYNYHIHYAIKANHNPVITDMINRFGLGADCVSGNEIVEALYRGFPANKIVYAGVGKVDDEIKLALLRDIFCFNCESIEELEVIEQVAKNNNKNAHVALRINPGIQPHTHYNITTGTEENKFGIHLSQLQQALDLCNHSPWLKFEGLHFHIGSQITSLKPFVELCKKVNNIFSDFEIQKYGGLHLNLGGGLAVDYGEPQQNMIPDFSTFFSVFAANLKVPQNMNIHFELGRSLVAQCGKLITKVLYTKKGINKTFLITDGGMTELMRPALYQAMHKIENISSKYPEEKYDIVGPICETTDVLAKDIFLPGTKRGDILAVYSCGAYAESMMLKYNMREKAKSFFLKNGKIFASNLFEKEKKCKSQISELKNY